MVVRDRPRVANSGTHGTPRHGNVGNVAHVRLNAVLHNCGLCFHANPFGLLAVQAQLEEAAHLVAVTFSARNGRRSGTDSDDLRAGTHEVGLAVDDDVWYVAGQCVEAHCPAVATNPWCR